MTKKALFFAGGVIVVSAVLFFTVIRPKAQDERSAEAKGRTSRTRSDSGVLSASSATGQDVPVPDSPAGPPREQGVSDTVQTLLSTENSYREKMAALKGLGRDLSQDDVEALRTLLNASAGDYTNHSAISFNSIRNDVLGILIDQHRMPEGLGAQVVALYQGAADDYMWQEYCLQFMGPLYEKQVRAVETAAPAGAEYTKRTEELTVVQDALFSALDQRDEDLAGTALLGLNRLSKKHTDLDRELILEKAVEMAGDTAASDRCRLTALRVAAAGERAEVLSAARDLAQHAETDLLRSAAITTLGDFAAPEDLRLLETLSKSGTRQIAMAARAALKRVRAEVRQPGE